MISFLTGLLCCFHKAFGTYVVVFYHVPSPWPSRSVCYFWNQHDCLCIFTWAIARTREITRAFVHLRELFLTKRPGDFTIKNGEDFMEGSSQLWQRESRGGTVSLTLFLDTFHVSQKLYCPDSVTFLRNFQLLAVTYKSVSAIFLGLDCSRLWRGISGHHHFVASRLPHQPKRGFCKMQARQVQ